MVGLRPRERVGAVSAPVPADAADRLLELIHGNWTTQAVGVAAELGLADLLAHGPRSIDELARDAQCDRDCLERLLHGLVSLGVCDLEADGGYALTPMGALLRRDLLPSVRSWAIYSALHSWKLWGHLLDSVRTGRSARKLLTGREGYAHLDEDAGIAAVFNRAMEEVTSLIATPVARTVEFGAMRAVCDVGGGHGELLAAVLRTHPHLEGAVFDLAHAAAGARRVLAAAGVSDRARVLSGSFFDRIPGGFDAYLLKSIVHNWDDAHAVEILRRCREACVPGARVVLVERVLPGRPTGAPAERSTLRSDINMMVSLGGRERTREAMAALLAEAGFAAPRCAPLGHGFNVLEAVAA